MTSTTPEPARVAAKTSYVILSRSPLTNNNTASGLQNLWKPEVTVDATSADAAVRQWAEKNAKDGIELVAVPSRSWQPRTIKVETSTKVTLG